MAEPSGVECKTGKFALARATCLQILEADGITEAHQVRAHIAGEQHPSWTPQQRDVSLAMPRGMNNFDAASDGQYFSITQRLVAIGCSRSSGSKNSLHNTCPNRPGAGVIGRNGPPLSAMGISSGCMWVLAPVSRTIAAALPI
jgi:hypothetical protein